MTLKLEVTKRAGGTLNYAERVQAGDQYFDVTVTCRRASASRSIPKTRVYVHAPNPEDVGGMAKPEYTTRGDDPENDKRWRQYNWQEIKVMRLFADAVLEDACKALGVTELGVIHFSRKAGCSCGCSPGFVARKGRGWNVWVDVELVEKK